MKRIFLHSSTVMVAWLSLVSLAARAQSSSAFKPAVLSVFRVIAECAEGKSANDEYQKKFDSKRDELEKKQKEIQDLQQQLQTQLRTLNDESRAEMEKSIERKTIDLQRSREDAEKEFGALRNEIFNRIGSKLMPVVQAYAKEYGYTLILDSSNQSSQLAYWEPGIDITDDIIKRYDLSQISSQAAPTNTAPIAAADKTN